MKKPIVELIPLCPEDREQFILDNQWAFKYGALQEFGERDDHLDADGEIISRKTIEHSMDSPQNLCYRIFCQGRKVGGLILKIDPVTQHNHLEILFISPEEHSKGIGYAAWQELERLYPDTRVWETCTPYFEKRNIHFYVNKCGFKIVEFWCEYYTPKDIPTEEMPEDEGPDEMFRFVKVMK